MFIKHGPGKKLVRFMVWLSWPVIKAGKKWSALPVLKWIINPFFMRPYNELTSIPIGADIRLPESVALPRAVVEKLVSKIEDKFIIDECICRAHNNVATGERGIGCMVLGPATGRMHPSHGRSVTTAEAITHIRRAGGLGLVANVAHVWIDPVAFWLDFRHLMFICFCDDTNCMYRTHMKKRGPSLDQAYRKLPGISLVVDSGKCDGCGICADRCFVGAIGMKDGLAVIDGNCKGCGRCADVCPAGAITLELDNAADLLARLEERIRGLADIPGI